MRSVAQTERTFFQTSCVGDTTSVLSSPLEVKELGETARHLLEYRDCTSQPEFFLAGLVPNRWAPRIAVVKDNGRIAGLVYLKERLFGGFRSGLLYGDSTLAAMVIAEPPNEDSVFISGIRALLESPRVHGLRLFVPPQGYELSLLRELQSEYSLDLQHRPIQFHSILPLDSTYEAFLGRLSPKTRRNFRYFRQRSQTANHRLMKNIRFDEYAAAANELLPQEVVGADRTGTEMALNMFAAAKRPLLAGLRSEHGEWLSIFGGLYESKRVVVLHQLNSDRKHPRDSLSLVMRAHMIEMLIEEGCREVHWWGGVKAPLDHYVRHISTLRVYVDKRTFGWRTFLRILSAHRHRLPQTMAYEVEWIVPSQQRPS